MTQLDHLSWKWPTGWKSVHLPDDTEEDFKLEMEIAEMMSEFEERDPEGYAAMMRKEKERNDKPFRFPPPPFLCFHAEILAF